MMPDRPVVVRPVLPMHVPKGQSTEFYVSIPLWIRIETGKTDKTVLCEKPSVVLSNTWFGDPVAGELCYSLNTRARALLEECSIQPHRALCRVTITNEHKEELLFERLCIRTDHLSLYQGEQRLIATEVTVVHQGDEKLSRIKYGKKQPSFGNIKQKLSESRKPADENLIRKSFSNIMSYTFY
jgi:hypothetical protein